MMYNILNLSVLDKVIEENNRIMKLLVFLRHFSSESSIETDFSGTTFTCAVVRGNNCVCANIGDSRTVIGFRDSISGFFLSSFNLSFS